MCQFLQLAPYQTRKRNRQIAQILPILMSRQLQHSFHHVAHHFLFCVGGWVGGGVGA
jgi:hypothetical protein